MTIGILRNWIDRLSAMVTILIVHLVAGPELRVTCAIENAARLARGRRQRSSKW